MANTYTQIHIQAVFVVKFREGLIGKEWKRDLFSYIGGIINKNGHQVLAINGMPDHIHVLFGFRPTQALADLLQDIKGSSSKWINDKGFLRFQFAWQKGYAAFSYSKKDLNRVIEYIENQEKHHEKKTFKEEYIAVLKEFEIVYDEKYLFHDPE